MKVAICLSGTLRQFRSCYPTFRKHIIEALPQYDFDIFMSSWDSKIQHFKSYHDIKDEGTFKEAIELFKPKKHSCPIYDSAMRKRLYEQSGMKEFQEFIWKNRKCDASHKEAKGKCRICLSKCVHNEIGMFIQIKNCNKLKHGYEAELKVFDNNWYNYDLIIRTRYDNFYISSLLEEYLEAADDRTLLVPEGFDGVLNYRNGCNDQIALGTSKVMDIYSSIYDNMGRFAIENAMHPQGTGCPHYFINLQMQEYGIEIKRIPLRYVLYKKMGVLEKKLKEGISWKDMRV